jgi:hypothetical protein
MQSLLEARAQFSKALSVPLILYLALDFVPEEIHILLDTMLIGVGIFLYTAICVTTHRMLLVGLDSVPEWGLRKITMREVLFAVCIGFLYGGVLLIFAAMYFAPFLEDIQRIALMFVLAFPASYFIARLSLVLPSIAVDSLMSFGESWSLTRGKPVFSLLILVPGVLGIFSSFIAALFGPFREIAGSALSCIILVYEIAILSMLYKSVRTDELAS